MGTPFLGRRMTGTWGPKGGQDSSAWDVYRPHAKGEDGMQLHKGFLRPNPSRAQGGAGPWRPDTQSERHPRICPQLRPQGRPRHRLGLEPGASRRWALTLALWVEGTLTLALSPSLPLSLHKTLPGAWVLTSALQGDKGSTVASSLATSPARVLTLAWALSPCGPLS